MERVPQFNFVELSYATPTKIGFVEFLFDISDKNYMSLLFIKSYIDILIVDFPKRK